MLVRCGLRRSGEGGFIFVYECSLLNLINESPSGFLRNSRGYGRGIHSLLIQQSWMGKKIEGEGGGGAIIFFHCGKF